MGIGPQSSQEVFDRFMGEVDTDFHDIGKYGREDFLIFPDNHPTTWIIAFVTPEGRFVVLAFYPHEANNHEFNDWEEFEFPAQDFIQHFGYDTCEEFFAKKKIKWEAWL